ncbi:MAG TPA: hypothetical protein VMU95_41230 [Trebonia sp.]|nr:hypothetical protein [Trebonia sp.]
MATSIRNWARRISDIGYESRKDSTDISIVDGSTPDQAAELSAWSRASLIVRVSGRVTANRRY